MSIKATETTESREKKGIVKESVDTQYWRVNIIVVSVLLVIWFLVSFVFGILLFDDFNSIKFYGFKLGFWWAHQGSIFIFVLLIFAYSLIMEKVDRRFASMMDKRDQG